MNDDKILLAHFSDRITSCKNDCVITHTRFLDIRQQSLFLSYPKDKQVVSLLFGGYDSAERKIGIFIPKLYGVETEDAYAEYDEGRPLKAIRITKDKFSSLSHRDYLGAIMNCGIKRETVGDIIVDEKGASVIVLEEVCEYLIQSLDRIGRGSCVCEKQPLCNFEAVEPNTVEFFSTVASLRLDNVVATAFEISRKAAVSAIEQKKVYVDGVLTEKNDFRVPVGAKIVYQGKGKAILSEQTGLSRKEREKIVIKRYI